MPFEKDVDFAWVLPRKPELSMVNPAPLGMFMPRSEVKLSQQCKLAHVDSLSSFPLPTAG